MDKQMIRDARNELVVKHNDLLRKSRYSLSATEQKILIYLISTIKAEDNDFLDITVSMNDMCDILGVQKNGREYDFLRASIQKLSDKSWWFDLSSEKKVLFRWITEVVTEDMKGIALLRLNKHLKPYLLELKENFTKYDLIYVLALKSAYSIRLYELLKSFSFIGEWRIDLGELRRVLQLEEKYAEFKILKRDVLNKAIKEINDYTDIVVSMESIKQGKKVIALRFTIKDKKEHEENWNTYVNLQKRFKND